MSAGFLHLHYQGLYTVILAFSELLGILAELFLAYFSPLEPCAHSQFLLREVYLFLYLRMIVCPMTLIL